MELLRDKMTERYQTSENIGFYGLDGIALQDSHRLRLSVRQRLEHLYQIGYRDFAVVSETGFSLLAFCELVRFQMAYIDIRILLFELVDLNMEVWTQAEKEEYIEVRRRASLVIFTISDNEIDYSTELARKLLKYCQHLICYVGNNNEHLRYLEKMIDVTPI
jgi:hypothetical protein